MGSFRRKRTWVLVHIIKNVKAINFLFSALYTTPFLYVNVYFGVLNMLHASIATSDTTRDSNFSAGIVAPNSVRT